MLADGMRTEKRRTEAEDGAVEGSEQYINTQALFLIIV